MIGRVKVLFGVLLAAAFIFFIATPVTVEAKGFRTPRVKKNICIASYEEGGDYYTEYYRILDTIRSFDDEDDNEYYETKTTECYRWVSDGAGGRVKETYYKYRIYYNYYPCLAAVVNGESGLYEWLGSSTRQFYLCTDLSAYYELYPNRDVTIDGCDHRIENAGENMDIFYVTGGKVTIKNLRLDGMDKICNVSGGTGVGSACITNDGGYLRLVDCEIYGSKNERSLGGTNNAGGTGIECFSGDTTIDGCEIHDCDGFGVYVGNWRAPNDCRGSSISVKNTKIYKCGGGISNTYASTVTLSGGSISRGLWYKTGLFNSEDGIFTMKSGSISDCDKGIINYGIFHMTGGRVYDNEVGVLQDGNFYMSGSSRVVKNGIKNSVFLMPGRVITVDKKLSGSGTLGAVMLLEYDRALGRKVLDITYNKGSEDDRRYKEAVNLAKHFVPAFDEIEDITYRNNDGMDGAGRLLEGRDVDYSHPRTKTHRAALRAGAGAYKYNGPIGSIVLSGVYKARFDDESGITDVLLTPKRNSFDFYWMEPMSFPTSTGIRTKLYGKNTDSTIALLGWCLKADGSKRIYKKNEIMTMPNDFSFYPVLDATFALTYHSNFKNPDRCSLGGVLETSCGSAVRRIPNRQEALRGSGIDTRYTVYPVCDNRHSENIIRGNSGPNDNHADYLKRRVFSVADDMNYGSREHTYEYKHTGWSPTCYGITYKQRDDTDPMSHVYVRDEAGDMKLWGDIGMDKDNRLRDNPSRLFRLRFLSDHIRNFGIDYTNDGRYFNLHLYSVWDEAPYIEAKNMEIMEGDIEESLKGMLLERIEDEDERHIKWDYEDDVSDLSVSVCDISDNRFLGRFHGLGDIGSVSVKYEVADGCGNIGTYDAKVTVLSGSGPNVLNEPDDIKSGLTGASFYYRFIDKNSRATLLQDSVWEKCISFRKVLAGFFKEEK